MATVADVMTKEVITTTPETPIRELAELLYTRRISGVPVVDEGGTLLGVVSEGDLIMHADTVGEQRRSCCMQQHRHEEFIRFLNDVERAVPVGKLIEAVVDN